MEDNIMYGLIDENGILVQKQPNPQLGFVEVPGNITCGMIYDDQSETWSYPEITLLQIKNIAISKAVTNYNQACADLIDLYMSPFEQLTWNIQVFEASLVNASGSSGANSTPFFDAFVAANPDFAGPGSTTVQNKAALKEAIESNNDEFAGAAGDLTGQLSAKRHAIITAADEAAVNAVDFTFTLPTVNLEDK